MKILIVGAGVIGTVYGAHLAAAGNQVSVLSHGRRTAEVAAGGLRAHDVLGGGRVEAGAEVVHSCANGLGERTGNAALEELIVALHVLYGYETHYDLAKLPELGELVSRISQFDIALNKPILGIAATPTGQGAPSRSHRQTR